MVQEETKLTVADNTGAKIVKCFRILGGTKRRKGGVGDIIICSVREAAPDGSAKEGEVVRAVIVRTRGSIRRKDGSRLQFDHNSCVLIDDKGNPKGTRIFGPVAREVRERGYLKISSLAPEVV
jgi:large subunit ribosomal protein L14